MEFIYHASFASPVESSTRGIQDQILEVTVISGSGLRNTEWVSTQDPYVVVKYGDDQYRTKTCRAGGTNPVFRPDKFKFKLIEGIREIKVVVYNRNKYCPHYLIGHGEVDLEDVFISGYKESLCRLKSDTGSAGEIKLLLHYPNAQNVQRPRPSPAPFNPAPRPATEPFQHALHPTPFPPGCPPPYPHGQQYQPQYPQPQQQQPPTNYPPRATYHPPNPNAYFQPSAPPIQRPPPGPVYPRPGFPPPSPYHGSSPPSPYNR